MQLYSISTLVLAIYYILLGVATSNSIISDEVFTHPYD